MPHRSGLNAIFVTRLPPGALEAHDVTQAAAASLVRRVPGENLLVLRSGLVDIPIFRS
jgi:hypothetical protein